jgi:hypothetical protein
MVRPRHRCGLATFSADAGSAGVGRCGMNRNRNPIGIIMAREAGRIPIG